MQFGLMFFASDENALQGDKYHLLIECAKFADQHGFSTVWVPERHFTQFGCLYPNPAVLHAALARETERIRLLAGSVVLPLHHPLRVAEEWSVVDNLSGGRIGISFASGWNPNDFAFFPERYETRQQEMFAGIETVQKLWRGESLEVTNGNGQQVMVRVYPTPVQKELPIWVTAASNPDTFIKAGQIGANLLTHTLDQDPEQLAEKIALYREARARHGHDPQAGQVTVMLHTFVGEEMEVVREQARQPYCDYLKSNAGLLKGLGRSRARNIDLTALSEKELDEFVNFLFERFASSRGLIGTPQSCRALVAQLEAAGVNEIACLLDFGPTTEQILAHLPYLNQLKDARVAGASAPLSAGPPPTLVPRTEGSGGDKGGWRQAREQLERTNGHLAGQAKTRERFSTPRQARGTASLAHLQARLREEVDVEQFYQQVASSGAHYGPRFRGITRLWQADDEALGQIQLPQEVKAGANAYQIHPVLLDNSFLVLASLVSRDYMSRSSPLLALPTGMEGLRVYKPSAGVLWSHVIRSSESESQGLVKGDVRILDQAGQLVAEAWGLRLQLVDQVMPTHQHSRLSELFYELQWLPQAPSGEANDTRTDEPVESVVEAGSWLILADQQGVGQNLANALTAQGQTVFLVEPGHSYQRSEAGTYQIDPERPEQVNQLIGELLAPPHPPCRGIIHLWALNSPPAQETTNISLETAQVLGAGTVFRLIQGLVGAKQATRLWLVTRGAQSVSQEESEIAVAQAPLWGVGRVMKAEHPELWGGLVDLDPDSSSDEAAGQLLNVLLHQDKDQEDQIAFRQAQRFVARLVRARKWAEPSAPIELQPEASYLITGGLGDLGLKVARFLVEKGARHLILLGRTPLPPRSEWQQVEPNSRLAYRISAVQGLEKLGANVHLAAVDVADEAQLSSFLATFEQTDQPAIRGVLHTAAVVQGSVLMKLKPDIWDAVWQPKAQASWLLHRLFEQTPLDFFVLFSAIPALVGWAGLGAANYAAANAFLDALAHQRRRENRAAISINWGPWSQVGMAARVAQGLEQLAQQGLGSISPQEGMAVLERILAHKPAQVAVTNFNWPQFVRAAPESATYPQLSQLASASQVARRSVNVKTQIKESPTRDALLAASEDERQHLLEAYFTEQVANVLKLPVSDVSVHQPLLDMGLDSLMAIELRNEIDNLGVNIPVITFLKGVSISELATEVVTQLDMPRSQPTTTVAVPVAMEVKDQDQDQEREEEEGLAAPPALVELQASERKRPFFCVTAGYGDLIALRNLAREIDPEQPFFALQPTIVTSLDTLVADYIEALRYVQPQGPYYLGGYSVGGLIAFEVAQQLWKQGERVELLALLDAPYTVSRSFDAVFGGIQKALGRFLPNTRREQRRIVQIATALFKDEGIDLHMRLLRGYVPRPYPGKITLFSPTWTPLRFSYRRWRHIAGEGFEFYRVPGDHDSFVRGVHSTTLAKRLRACLDHVNRVAHEPRTEIAPHTTVSHHYDYLSGINESLAKQGLKLTFGVFPQKIANFSWLLTFYDIEKYPEYAELSHQSQIEFRQLFFGDLPFSSIHNVLDFGCGYATDLIDLAQQHPHLQLNGYTISANQAQLGRQRAQTHDLAEHITIYHRDSSKTPFPKMYDLVFGFEVAVYIKDKASLFQNIASHLNEGGLLLLADFVANTNFPIEHDLTSSYIISQPEWLDLLAKNNLKLVKSLEITQEVANFLYDPNFEQNLAQLARDGMDNLVQEHFRSWYNLGRVLEKKFARYLLLTIEKDSTLAPERLNDINQQYLSSPTPYSSLEHG